MLFSVSSIVFLVLLAVFPSNGQPVSEKQYINSDFYQRLARPHVKVPDMTSLAKLLDERVNWKDEETEEKQIVTDKHIDNYSGLTSDQTSRDGKRNLKFNPTGWRKKRSTEYLTKPENIPGMESVLSRDKRSAGTKGGPFYISDDFGMTNPVRRNVDDRTIPRLHAILANLRSLLAKRKGPLDFNPTGW